MRPAQVIRRIIVGRVIGDSDERRGEAPKSGREKHQGDSKVARKRARVDAGGDGQSGTQQAETNVKKGMRARRTEDPGKREAKMAEEDSEPHVSR